VVQLSEHALAMAVAIKANRNELEDEEKVARLSRYTAGERAALRMLAPMAAPYVETTAGRFPAFGAILFGLVFVMTLGDRMRKVDALTGEGEASDAAQAQRQENDEQEHRTRWGNAAGNVPLGTKIRDSHKFPVRTKPPTYVGT